jgi:hypothetical protein
MPQNFWHRRLKMKKKGVKGAMFGLALVFMLFLNGCATFPPLSTAYQDSSVNWKEQALLLVIPDGVMAYVNGLDYNVLPENRYSIFGSQVGIIPTGEHTLSLEMMREGKEITTYPGMKVSHTFEAGGKYILYCTGSVGREVNFLIGIGARVDATIYTVDEYLAWYGKEKPKRLENEKIFVEKKFADAEAVLLGGIENN